jgi:hypothetical protein
MKAADLIDPKDEKYKLFTFKVSLNISRDGSVEIEEIDVDPGLPKEKIVDFFKNNNLDISVIPNVFAKWHLRDEYFSFRNPDDRVARREKQQQAAEARKERQVRMTAERINGVYIPKDLGECFVEMDKQLNEVDKKEMTALPNRDK